MPVAVLSCVLKTFIMLIHNFFSIEHSILWEYFDHAVRLVLSAVSQPVPYTWSLRFFFFFSRSRISFLVGRVWKCVRSGFWSRWAWREELLLLRRFSLPAVAEDASAVGIVLYSFHADKEQKRAELFFNKDMSDSQTPGAFTSWCCFWMHVKVNGFVSFCVSSNNYRQHRHNQT